MRPLARLPPAQFVDITSPPRRSLTRQRMLSPKIRKGSRGSLHSDNHLDSSTFSRSRSSVGQSLYFTMIATVGGAAQPVGASGQFDERSVPSTRNNERDWQRVTTSASPNRLSKFHFPHRSRVAGSSDNPALPTFSSATIKGMRRVRARDHTPSRSNFVPPASSPPGPAENPATHTHFGRTLAHDPIKIR
jgi:hypothetical protein